MDKENKKEEVLREISDPDDISSIMKYLLGGSSRPDGIIRHIYTNPGYGYEPTKVIISNGDVIQQIPVPTQIPHIVSIKLYNTKETKGNKEKLELIQGFLDGYNFTMDFEDLYQFNSKINKKLPYKSMQIIRLGNNEDIVWRISDVVGHTIEFHYTTEEEISAARGSDLTQGEDFKITQVHDYEIPEDDLIAFSKSPVSSTWRFSANPVNGKFMMSNNLINDNYDPEYDSIVLNNELLRGINVKKLKSGNQVSKVEVTTLNSEHSNRVLWSFKITNDTFIAQSFMVALDYPLYNE